MKKAMDLTTEEISALSVEQLHTYMDQLDKQRLRILDKAKQFKAVLHARLRTEQAVGRLGAMPAKDLAIVKELLTKDPAKAEAMLTDVQAKRKAMHVTANAASVGVKAKAT